MRLDTDSLAKPCRRTFLKALGAGGIALLSGGTWGCVVSGNVLKKPSGDITYTIVNEVKARFATFRPLPVSVAPSLRDYTIDAGLSGITFADRMGFSDAEKKKLAANMFFLRPSGDGQIYDVYNQCKDAGIPAFVTTDSVLHAYHILFDYILRILEVQKFSPAIVELSRQMMRQAKGQYDSGVEEVRDAALRDMAFFKVALTLFGVDESVPAEAQRMADSELKLIEKHEGFEASPIFSYQEDYSQYVPRGHYTRNETLKKYFRGMMWYGRMQFRIKTKDEELNRLQARMSLLIAMGLKGETFDLWKKVYDPTVFFVGKSDDLSIWEYLDAMKKVYGDSISLGDLKDAVKLQSFMDYVATLNEPKIISTYIEDREDKATLKGFRFMGQRFIPDSYIFQELVYDKVGSQGVPRLFPKGLDALAALGSSRAYDILVNVYDEDRFENYEKQMASLKAQFAAFKEDTWTQNLYWCWLYCLLALLNEKGDGYPSFMKRQSWVDKELNASLGSWTELRHDTILYAKQSYTVKVTAMLPQEPAKGYVEPNPELYGRLASLAQMTIDGLGERGLLIDELNVKLVSLRDLLKGLKTISEKELTGTRLSGDEESMIENYGSSLSSITTFSSEVNDSVSNEADKDMAVVADVHTDVNSGMVLEEAVGHPYHIFVVVEKDGKKFVAKGAAFSYYEWQHPMADRLTDEAWQQILASGKEPKTPEWTASFKA